MMLIDYPVLHLKFLINLKFMKTVFGIKAMDDSKTFYLLKDIIPANSARFLFHWNKPTLFENKCHVASYAGQRFGYRISLLKRLHEFL